MTGQRLPAIESLQIREASHADIPHLLALPFSAGLSRKHQNRIERQDRDEALYLLALLDERIIGHLLLKWNGPFHERVRRLAPPCAEVEDFVVDPALRGRGAGGALLTAADDRCRERGVRWIGLSVGLENPSARAIYEHRGYVLVPGSEHRVSWLRPEPSGGEVEAHEDCVYLVKDLA